MRQPRNKIGQWIKRPIGIKNKKLTNILLAEIAIFFAIFFLLADHAFGFVAEKIYPEPPMPTIEPKTPPEPILSLSEHICIATNGENCDVLVNLAKCESSMRKDAIHVNTNGTYDAGLFQINSVHKDISLEHKLDVYASSRWANEQIKKGNGHWWVCWNKI